MFRNTVPLHSSWTTDGGGGGVECSRSGVVSCEDGVWGDGRNTSRCSGGIAGNSAGCDGSAGCNSRAVSDDRRGV